MAVKLFSKFYNLKYSLPPILFLTASLFFHFSSPNIPDPDSFYHIKHAELYRTEKVTLKEFPWTQYSAIKTNASDIWYGFHILLIPFSLFENTLGIKLAGVFLTFFAFYAIYFVLRKLGAIWPGFWVALTFISAPNIMNRFLMMRPHLLSLALEILLFYFLIQKKNWPILITSLLITWVHLSLSWISFLILGIILICQLILEKRFYWKNIILTLTGSLLGWLLRPNPLGALKLAYIQVVELMIQKSRPATLLFGRELFPLAPQTLFQNFSAFIILWLLAVVVLINLAKRHINILKNVGVLSSGILSLIFFVLTILVARRSHDFWIPFGVIFIALVLTSISRLGTKNTLNSVTLFITGLVFLFLIIYTPYRNSISLEERAIPPDKFKISALWLKENSQLGDIVFNMRWSDFPMLFYWNDKNYYIGGMDPIFQYAYDKKLYWEFHYLSADEVTKYTCPAPACTKEMLGDTYTVLKNDFKAKYIFLEKQRNPLVYYYLESTPEHYEKKIDTKAEAVYEIK